MKIRLRECDLRDCRLFGERHTTCTLGHDAFMADIEFITSADIEKLTSFAKRSRQVETLTDESLHVTRALMRPEENALNQETTKMYLRYTETPEDDLVRNTSYHDLGFYQGEDAEIDAEYSVKPGVIEVGARYVEVIGGLCGYLLEAETLEDAVAEVKSNPMDFPYVNPETSSWAIYEGCNPKINNTFGDGDIFRATVLLYVEKHQGETLMEESLQLHSSTDETRGGIEMKRNRTKSTQQNPPVPCGELRYFNCFFRDGVLFGHPAFTPNGEDRLDRIGRMDEDGLIHITEPTPE